MIRFFGNVCSVFAFVGILGAAHVLFLTPYGLMALPFLLVGLLALWLVWVCGQRLRLASKSAYWPVHRSLVIGQLSPGQRADLIIDAAKAEAFERHLWSEYWRAG
jgi:hypothetical protein